MLKIFGYHFSLILCVYFLTCFTIQAQETTLYVSEFMSANANNLADEHEDFDDWIEIHNYGNPPIDLQGLFISDTEDNLQKYKFENSLIVEAEGYVLLWADNSTQQGSHHLNFKISENEHIILSDEDEIIDIVKIENPKIDISQGKISKSSPLCYFKNPTPGLENSAECFAFLSPVNINYNSGNYAESISIELSQEEDAEIYFTLDGSIPDLQSQFYTGQEIEISTNTTIRTLAVKEGFLDSEITTRTYLFDDKSSIPILFVTSNGNKIDGSTNVNVNLEYVDVNGEQVFEESASSRLHGKIDQLSFKVFFGAKHGGKKINKPLFNDKPEVDKFESLIFRQAGNDDLNSSAARRAHMRDGFLCTVVNRGDFNFKTSGFEQVSVYLDGDYYGIFNMRERIDKSFIENNYNVDASDSLCFIEYKFGAPSNINEIEGAWSYYNDVLWSKCFDADLSGEAVYSSAIKNLNVSDFTDYWMHEVFIANFDWLTNNVYFWSPVGNEGKFRWILWDTDVSIGLNGDPDWNSLEWATSTEPGRPFDGRRTAIIRGLLTNESYQEYFITRFCDLLNSEYKPESTIRLLDELASNIRAEVPKHTLRWGRGSLEKWEEELERIRMYMTERPDYVQQHIKSKFPQLGEMYNLDLQTSISGAGYFDVNTIKISELDIPWNGKYFDDLSLSITVHTNEGYRFVGWQHTDDISSNINLNPFQDTTIIALFEVINDSEFDVVINEISYQQNEYKSDDWLEVYNNSSDVIDLSGWTLVDASVNNDPFVFPTNTTLNPDQFIVIVKDENDFRSTYPNVEFVLGELDFGLSKNGDCLKLYDSDSRLVDIVDYKVESPWPNEVDANSIELINADLDNNIGESWMLATNKKASPGFTNGQQTTNVKDANIKSELFEISPNPTNGIVRVKCNSNGTLKIYNAVGEILHSSSVSSGFLNLNLTKYPKGTYVISFEGKNGVVENEVLYKQ